MSAPLTEGRPWPSFPPGYTAKLCIDDPFATACAAAAQGAEDGLLLWCDRPDRFEAAVVLRPLDPLPAALTLAGVGMAGLLDGLAALVPPETPISVAWPDRLLVNEGCVGGIRMKHGPLVDKEGIKDAPDWLVLGATVQMMGDRADPEPGRNTEYTNLHEEGGHEVTVPELVESFSRHLLHWLDSWQEIGFDQTRRHLSDHLADKSMKLDMKGSATAKDGERHLAELLDGPSWRLPGT